MTAMAIMGLLPAGAVGSSARTSATAHNRFRVSARPVILTLVQYFATGTAGSAVAPDVFNRCHSTPCKCLKGNR